MIEFSKGWTFRKVMGEGRAKYKKKRFMHGTIERKKASSPEKMFLHTEKIFLPGKC